MAYKAYKFRIYPTASQQELITKTFGCCRYVFNYYLNLRKEKYEANGETFGLYSCHKDLTALKAETPWLKEVDSTALCSALNDLDAAYKNFFKRKEVRYPRFKSKHNPNQSYTTKSNIKVFDKHIQLPKLGLVRCKVSRQIEGRIITATVSRNPSGHYFVSVACGDIETEEFPKTEKSVGIYLGLHSSLVTSEGETIESLQALTKSQEKLARLQRALSRKEKDSANREKARLRVAKLHERIVNQRRDFLHKLSSRLIENYDVICIENLPVAELMQTHSLAKELADASWAEFIRQLEYKAEWYGKQVVRVDSSLPFNKCCSCCGAVNDFDESEDCEQWECPECETVHNRNINAAVNILNEGLRILA